MNRFVANRSIFFLVISWVFAAAFINDQANLTDILPQTATLHFDEGDGFDAYAQFNSLSTISHTGGIIRHAALDTHEYRQVPRAGVRHVILDEDSPSIAAVSIHTEFACVFIPQPKTSILRSYDSNSSIYLQNCTLLI